MPYQESWPALAGRDRRQFVSGRFGSILQGQSVVARGPDKTSDSFSRRPSKKSCLFHCFGTTFLPTLKTISCMDKAYRHWGGLGSPAL